MKVKIKFNIKDQKEQIDRGVIIGKDTEKCRGNIVLDFYEASLPFGQKLDVDANVSDVAHWTRVSQAQSRCLVLFCSVLMRTDTNRYANPLIPFYFFLYLVCFFLFGVVWCWFLGSCFFLLEMQY